MDDDHDEGDDDVDDDEHEGVDDDDYIFRCPVSVLMCLSQKVHIQI